MEEQIQTKIWKNTGDSDPPLLWALKFWPPAIKDADFLTDVQYWHVRDQLLELGRATEPTKCSTLDIQNIDEFWELKDKGGVLGKINLRVFFVVNPACKEIVVLGVHKKEDERQLRRSVVISIRRRLTHYQASIGTEKGGRS